MSENFLRYMPVILALSPLADAWAEVRPLLHYQPEEIQVAGTLETQTFAGPPNYESIAGGDEIERGWYLRLDSPVDVVATRKTTDQNADTERKVSIIQIAVVNDEIWKKLRNGEHCRIRGTLFHRLTGHHHARVLIEAMELKDTGKSK